MPRPLPPGYPSIFLPGLLSFKMPKEYTSVMKLVAAAIARREGRILVTRRAAGQNLAGMWEFPGGKLEPAETPQACIIRELREELGVGASAGEVLTESVYEYPGGAIRLIGVEVELEAGDFQLTVHDAFVWLEPAQLLSVALAPADIPIAEEIARRHG